MSSASLAANFHHNFLRPSGAPDLRQTYCRLSLPSSTSNRRSCYHHAVGTEDEAARLSGIRTPPTDDMSTAYSAPQFTSYDGHGLSATYSSALAQSTSRAKSSLSEAVARQQSQPSRYQPSNLSSSSASQSSHLRNGPGSGSSQRGTVSRHSTRPSTPVSGGSTMSSQRPESLSRRGSAAVGYPSCQIPSSISPKGGSLSDFAAQMTCLFWFETIDVLRSAETIRERPPNTPVARLTKCATPYGPFKKWVYNVVSTTQVSDNVILLALLFIYRLKTTNPAVKGRSGSEYRLLTVALMLGNKFLDDNTYTNKTWAEVSGMSVHEIHVMEVEFLGNMRYSLLATKEEWDAWLLKLASFYTYYERAQMVPTSPTALSSPTAKSFHSPLPSPPTHYYHNQLPTTPTPISTYSAGPVMPVAWPALQNAPTMSSPLSAHPNGIPGGISNGSRKRISPEDDVTEPPAKRQARPPQVLSSTQPNAVTSRVAEPPRLPVPHLTLNTNALPPNYAPPATYAGQPLSLPPLVPGVRAMVSVYGQNPSPATTQPLPMPMPTATVPTPQQLSGVPYGTPSLPTHQGQLAFGTPTNKRHSPGGSLGHYASSPLTETFPQSAVHTPLAHTPLTQSPSVYLQGGSPYKPVRGVNTLLCPPPSASLHEYHLSIPPTNMHYRPIGRRHDLRTGIVPEFVGISHLRHPQGLSHQQPRGTPGQAQNQLQYPV